ncbi:MAG TPA: hypothetical protein VFM69_07495 [Pricia sp.]|nr:hypothetical protein [Pricia sp.]
MSEMKNKSKENKQNKENKENKGDNLIEKSENQSLKEQAIDESATHGERINHQVKDKKNHHQPRDKA